MALVLLGALFLIVGVGLAAGRTAARGRLSQPPHTSPRPDTLEPTGSGRRLSLKADLPGLALAGLGVVLIVIGALVLNAASVS